MPNVSCNVIGRVSLHVEIEKIEYFIDVCSLSTLCLELHLPSL